MLVERVVDGRGRDAETACGGAIDDEIEPPVPAAADRSRHRPFAATGCSCCDQPRHPGGEFGGVGVFEHEMVLRAADRRIDGEILHRLHVERDADNAGRFAAQAPDDLRWRSGFAVVRLER